MFWKKITIGRLQFLNEQLTLTPLDMEPRRMSSMKPIISFEELFRQDAKVLGQAYLSPAREEK